MKHLKGMARFAGPFLLLASTLNAEPLDLSKGRIPFVPSLSALFQVSQPVSGIQYTAPGGTFSGGTITSPILAANGTAGAPSYSFSGSPTWGMFLGGAPDLAFSASGTEVARITGAGIAASINGSAATPSIFNNNFTTTGLYWAAGPTLGFATGGTAAFTINSTQQLLGVNGTQTNPTYAFTAQGGTGIFNNTGSNDVSVSMNGTRAYAFNSNDFYILNAAGRFFLGGTDTTVMRGGTDGALRLQNNGTTPTISSGFGTTPSVVAGGTNSLFQVNVGTGGTATSGVVAFHGTWTNAPKCFANDETTTDAVPTHAVATTSQVTLSISTAWATGTLVDVFCISN